MDPALFCASVDYRVCLPHSSAQIQANEQLMLQPSHFRSSFRCRHCYIFLVGRRCVASRISNKGSTRQQCIVLYTSIYDDLRNALDIVLQFIPHGVLLFDNLRRDDFEQVREAVLHGVSLLLPLMVSIIGLALGVFNWGGGFRCWVAPSPLGCDRFSAIIGECTRGEHATAFEWAFINVPLYVSSLVFYMAVIRVYCQFRKTTRNARRSSMTNATANTGRQLAVQCTLYGLFFANTCIWFVILSILDAAGKTHRIDRIYPIIVLTNIFYPMQGFFNFFIYIRPRYLRIRRENASKSRGWALCVIFRYPQDEDTTTSSSLSSGRSRFISFLRRSSELWRSDPSSEIAMGTSNRQARNASMEQPSRERRTEQPIPELTMVVTSNGQVGSDGASTELQSPELLLTTSNEKVETDGAIIPVVHNRY
jgi:hypothetical protein